VIGVTTIWSAFSVGAPVIEMIWPAACVPNSCALVA